MERQSVNTAATFSRRDTSILGRWWWTVDRWSLMILIVLMVLGMMISFAASPPVAERLNIGTFYFVKRHFMMMAPSLTLLICVSLLPPRQARRLATLVYLVGILLLILTMVMGEEIKGAQRWISIAGISIQASEFVKPAFAVMAAWMMAERYRNPQFPSMIVSFILLGIFVTLLLLQPDLGMTVVVVATWVGQLFIAGIPMIWMVGIAILGVSGLVAAYFFFPHVAKRIDQFLDPSASDPQQDLYQVTQSLEAFMNGGVFGQGPGEGVVKHHLPDAHSDFVFAVIGEEFGLILCLLLVVLFGFVVIRSFLRIIYESSLFVILATSGLIMQFGLQALINMASALHLIPTKGMTMPFISYGGSSMLAVAFATGMVLALTRKRSGIHEVV